MAEPTTQTPYEDMFFAGMEKKNPELKGNREGMFKAAKENYDRDHEYAKKSMAEADQLKEILSSNEDLNNLFVEIFERGKDGHPELALIHMKPLMQQYINGEITSEEYLAEKKRMEDEANSKTEADKMKEEAFAEVCAERGWDVGETLKKLQAVMEAPADKEKSKEQVRNFLKILDYDDAIAAAETRGRNAKIEEQRRNTPSGGAMPRNGGAPAGAQPSKKVSPLATAADAAEKQRKLYS